MLNNTKGLSIWKRYIIIILIIIMTSFLINKMLFLPMTSRADSNAWVQYWGSITGALVAGLVTLWGIENTIKNTLRSVTPLIRPINTEFYIYQNNKGNYVMTDKDLSQLVEDYHRNVEMETDRYKMLIIDILYERILSQRENSRWQKDVGNVSFENFKSEIIKVCKYNNRENTFSNLDGNAEILDDASYNEGTIRETLHNMKETYIQRIADRVFLEEKMKEMYSNVMVPVYNVGAGNAIDVSFNWTLKESGYRKILNKIGFNDEDYARLNEGFTPININPSSTDILLNINGENKMNLPLVNQLADLVKHIFIKRQNNKNENIVINDDLGVNYSRIADLHIECKDIYGDPNENSYKVLLKMIDNIGEEYGYKKTHVDLKFEEY